MFACNKTPYDGRHRAALPYTGRKIFWTILLTCMFDLGIAILATVMRVSTPDPHALVIQLTNAVEFVNACLPATY